MKKNLNTLITLMIIYISLILSSAFAFNPKKMGHPQLKECLVDGISDGPQQLDCFFGKKEFLLRCQKGQYRFNNQPVFEAYHLEVESGPTPLVFKFSGGELTVLMKQRSTLRAKLKLDKNVLKGFCRQ